MSWIDGAVTLITGVGTAAGTVIGTIGEASAKEKQYEAQIQEFRYKEAQERRAAAEAATSKVTQAINSDTVKNITLWSLTAIASAVLVKVVFNAAGIGE